MDELLVESALDSWESVSEAIAEMDAWVLDPASRVTRAAVSERLGKVGGAVLVALRDLLSGADLRLREAVQDERDACEAVLGSEGPRIGIRERYAVALRILEDARVSERDIERYLSQADPVKCILHERGQGR